MAFYPLDNLYIDIETIPAVIPNKDDIAAEIKPPKSMSKKETIEKWEREKKPAAIEEEYDKQCKKRATDYLDSQIICIAFTTNRDKEITSVYNQDEKELINTFLDVLSQQDELEYLRWIGFNIKSFDIPMLWWKVVKYQLDSAHMIPVVAPYEKNRVYDPMKDNPMTRDYVGKPIFKSQDAMCKYFGLEGKSNMTGADVLPYYLDDRHEEIEEYCRQDVQQLKELCCKLGKNDRIMPYA